MARLWSSGFELNTVTNLLEGMVTGNGQSISTSTVRSGTYSLQANPSAQSTGLTYIYSSTQQTTNIIYARAYINISSFPTSTTNFFVMACQNSSAANAGSIKVNGSNQLQLFNAAGAQVGSNSTALSTGTWYRIELKVDATSSPGSIEGLLNGVSFASGANSSQVGNSRIQWLYTNSLTNTFNIFLDDIAVNDSSGAFQTAYPGDGKVINLQPSATGDVNTFATQTGGTAGAANNFSRVNEVPPDDATTFNGSNTLNQEDLFNMTDSGIGASDTVNVVSVGARFRNNTADATTAVKFEIEKAASGTILQSSAVIPNTTAFNTNGFANPHSYPITTYQDPNSSNWTQTTLDSMQVGYKLTTGGTNRIEVSTVWAVVDYTPSVSNDLSVNVSDTITTSEFTICQFQVSASDTITTSESMSSYSDQIFTREQITVQSVAFVSVSDTITTSENVIVRLQSNIAVSDTITLSENLAELLISLISVSDTLTLSESVSVVIPTGTTLTINVSDTITTSESIKLLSEENVNVSDTITTSENVLRLLSSNINISDTITTSENRIVFEPFYNISVSDTITTSEASSISEITNGAIVTSENLTLSESVSILIPVLFVTVSDTITTSENVAVSLTIGVDVEPDNRSYFINGVKIV